MNKIVAFGEIMMRLTPTDNLLLEETNKMDVCYGGSEANVLVCLSHLNNETSFVSRIPNNKLGEGVIRHLKVHNVGIDSLIKNGSTLGLYFLENGFGGRSSKVIYHRKNAEVNNLKLEDLDLDLLFKDASWFHTSGITLGISDNARKLAIELCKEANKRGIKVSFDFNYRSSLWSTNDAKKAYQEILPFVDVLFGNVFDLNNFLDIDAKDELEACKALFNKYNTKYLLHTIRTINSATNNSLEAIAYANLNKEVKVFKTLKGTFDILDRIGSGDAFDAGIIDYLNKGKNIEDALIYALKLAILKHFVKGDALILNKQEIDEFTLLKNRDVKR